MDNWELVQQKGKESKSELRNKSEGIKGEWDRLSKRRGGIYVDKDVDEDVDPAGEVFDNYGVATATTAKQLLAPN